MGVDELPGEDVELASEFGELSRDAPALGLRRGDHPVVTETQDDVVPEHGGEA